MMRWGLVWLILQTACRFMMISPKLHAIWPVFFLNLSQNLILWFFWCILGPWATANYCRAGIKSLRGTTLYIMLLKSCLYPSSPNCPICTLFATFLPILFLIILKGPKHEIFEIEFFYTNQTCTGRWLGGWWKKMTFRKLEPLFEGFHREFLIKRTISMRLKTKKISR